MTQVEKFIKSCLTFLEQTFLSGGYDVASVWSLLKSPGKRLYLIVSGVALGLFALTVLLSLQPLATAGGLSGKNSETLENQAIAKRIQTMNPQELAQLIDRVDEEIDHQVLYQDETQSQASNTPSLSDPLGPQEEMSLLSLAEGADINLEGRSDPFSPLVQDSTLTGGSTPLASPLPGLDMSGKPLPPKDVLEDIEFVGLIDGKNPVDKVAILKVKDPEAGEKTVVKKLGESFTYDNHRIVLKKINRYQLSLTVNGKLRSKALSPFVDNLKEKEEDETTDEKETIGVKSTYGEGGNTASTTPNNKLSLKGLQE